MYNTIKATLFQVENYGGMPLKFIDILIIICYN